MEFLDNSSTDSKSAYMHYSCLLLMGEVEKVENKEHDDVPCFACRAPKLIDDDAVVRVTYKPTLVELVVPKVQAVCDDGRFHTIQFKTIGVKELPIPGQTKLYNATVGGVVFYYRDKWYFKTRPLGTYAQAMYELAASRGKDIPYAQAAREISPKYQPTLAEVRAGKKAPKPLADFSSVDTITEARLAFNGLHPKMKDGKAFPAVVFSEYITNREFFDAQSQRYFDDEARVNQEIS